ncbi:Rap1a/Tai family immunity protein, partial [Salmonella enterica subsp. enterica serovar Infantis]
GNEFLKYSLTGKQRDKLSEGVYMLVVQHETENKLWCGYALFKTLTLKELVYVSIKNKNKDELNSRAAHIIINKLKEYTCK